MMITRVTSGVTNVNRLFTKINKNWKIKKFDYYTLTDNITDFKGSRIESHFFVDSF